MSAGKHNFDWQRDELILACDLVTRNGWRQLRATDQVVTELSAILQEPWLHPREGRSPKFRSVGSVQRKTADLATHHPDYQGSPTKGGALDRLVISDFLDDPEGMREIASMIRLAITSGAAAPTDPTDVDDLVGAREGLLLSALVSRRERDPELRKKKIAAVRARGERIQCEVCTFDFGARYPGRGDGYIEVHHRRPLHTTGPVVTRLKDLALLCANCHRMIHRGPWITVEQLAALAAYR